MRYFPLGINNYRSYRRSVTRDQEGGVEDYLERGRTDSIHHPLSTGAVLGRVLGGACIRHYFGLVRVGN